MIEVVQGDITRLKVDAIVNAANSRLMAGGGVDGAIHRAGGKEIDDELENVRRRQGGCPPGEAVITSGGKLWAKHVIHTVGPIWQGGSQMEEETLAQAYRSCLQLAAEHQLSHIAFPNISTGVYGFPKKPAAKIAIKEVRLFWSQQHPYPRQVTFCCFDSENYDIYLRMLDSANQ